jgi:predicted GTPase
VFRNWRAWVLIVLLVGPVLAYLGFGALWLMERGWLLIAGALWVASGIVFAFLASRWTRSTRPLLPPLDWDAPKTFSPFDRKAWKLVEEESEKGDALSMEALSGFDVYMETGRRLTRRLAEHYHPLSSAPIEHVPVVELLTALELAAEDLNRLCRQIPGGDLITPAHWKTAVQAAGYIQKANDIYSYLLPIFRPTTGLARLGAQQLVGKPAWKNMQQNVLRWFFCAFVNRLGTHLIELYSGRLAIGTDQYRKLTRKSARTVHAVDGELAALTVTVAGARDAGKTRLLEAIEQARSGDLTLVKARLEATGLDEVLIERLKTVRWVEVPSYTATPGGETARDRSTRRAAVEVAVESDLLILVVDVGRDTQSADAAFAQAWDRWYVEHPVLEAPPAMVVLTGADRPELGYEWTPPYNWAKGQRPREAAVRARFESLRAALPPTFAEIVAVGLGSQASFGIVEQVLPTLVTLLHRSERVALIRQLHRHSTRSKARRLVSQVGQHGRWLWNSLRSGRKSQEHAQEPSQS